eukprot:CAMPEP_0203952580 /NCGR_PEP_ID=MMETSP0359-20131031/86184_1 /ASSEMBLY_ACC=CAM_ASM_000338 /TAXON_ID=268821 /ORGANISM="Scrippsiella Hangoei, Strain SHTV-5" /LENGTH=690 /DNA_ID=CAMNT_0050885611 /DNA_START=55 /DNA_END=2127 /DNA_ORIENTATION=+
MAAAAAKRSLSTLEGEPNLKRRRTLPGASPANPNEHFFIAMDEDMKFIVDESNETADSFLIRAPPGSGKSTLAQLLCARHNFVYLPLNDFRLDGKLCAGLVLVQLQTAAGRKLDINGCLRLLHDQGRGVAVDEAQLLWDDVTSDLCLCFVKPTYPFRRLLFTTNSEHVVNGEFKVTPAEIFKKWSWRAQMPCEPQKSEEMAPQLGECGVYLQSGAIEVLAHMSGLHRGIFVRALHWVHSVQKSTNCTEPWASKRLVAEVLRDPEKFQESLLSSRAVRVNGRNAVPPPALQALAEGVSKASSFPAEMVRRALTLGFVRPATGRDPGPTQFPEYDLKNGRYQIANSLQAVEYRKELADSGIELTSDPPCRAADVLLRCLPHFFLHELVRMVKQDLEAGEEAHHFYAASKSVPLPYENAWNDLLLETFNKDLLPLQKRACTVDTKSKPDFLWERSSEELKLSFVIEAVMWDNEINEHMERFLQNHLNSKTLNYQKSTSPGWASARGLWIIAPTEKQAETSMKKAELARVPGESCDVEVMGVVPQPGYCGMIFLCLQSDGVVFRAEVPCDGVPRKLTTGEGERLRVDVARRVTCWGRVLVLQKAEELAGWIGAQVAFLGEKRADLVVRSFEAYTGRMFAEASEEKLAEVIGDRMRRQLEEARLFEDRDLFHKLNSITPVAVAARLIAARDWREV